MSKYAVLIKTYTVEADSEELAIQRAINYEGLFKYTLVNVDTGQTVTVWEGRD